MSWAQDGRTCTTAVQDNKKGILFLGKRSEEKLFLPAPENCIDCRHVDGVNIAVVRSTTEKGNSYLLYGSQGYSNKWNVLGRYQPEIELKNDQILFYNATKTPELRAYPLGKDKFLLMGSINNPIIAKGKASLFAIAGLRGNGDYEVKELIDIGKIATKKSEFFQNKEKKYWGLTEDNFFVANMSLDNSVISVENYYIVTSRQAGLFFRINKNSGTLDKVADLYGMLTDNRLKNIDQFEYVVICAQPNKTGDVLIAARSEAAVLMSRKEFPRQYTSVNMKNEKARQELNSAEERALKAFPEVVWWRLDVDQMKIVQEASPINVPTKIFDITTFKEFSFIFNPSGNLVFPQRKNGFKN